MILEDKGTGFKRNVKVKCESCNKERNIKWETARNKNIHLCRACSISGQRHPNFGKHRTKETINKIRKGNITKGWRYQGNGYKGILVDTHPRAKSYKGGNYVMEHILVIEKFIGRFLTPQEIIHHIDGDKLNNKIENLFLCSGNSKKHSKQIHNRCHDSLEKLAFQLVKEGIIVFNNDVGYVKNLLKFCS